MNINCQTFEHLLSEGDSASLERARMHAEECASCLDKLATWNEISDVARSMRATWTSDLLWPRIERTLRADSRRSWRRILEIAAAIVLTVGLGGLTWRALQVRKEEKEFTRRILVEGAVQQVEASEKQHVAAINRLEKLAEPKLEEQTPLMVSYKEKLMVLDDAIAECQSSIRQNRYNAHVRKQLLAIYSEKRRTLQDVLTEARNVSNQ